MMIIFNMLAIFVNKWTVHMYGLMLEWEVPSALNPGTSKTAAWCRPCYFHCNRKETSQEQVVFMRN